MGYIPECNLLKGNQVKVFAPIPQNPVGRVCFFSELELIEVVWTGFPATVMSLMNDGTLVGVKFEEEFWESDVVHALKIDINH